MPWNKFSLRGKLDDLTGSKKKSSNVAIAPELDFCLKTEEKIIYVLTLSLLYVPFDDKIILKPLNHHEMVI